MRVAAGPAMAHMKSRIFTSARGRVFAIRSLLVTLSLEIFDCDELLVFIPHSTIRNPQLNHSLALQLTKLLLAEPKFSYVNLAVMLADSRRTVTVGDRSRAELC